MAHHTDAAAASVTDQLVDVAAASRILGLAEVTIRKLVRSGELPHIRPLGRRAIRFRISDLRQIASGRAA